MTYGKGDITHCSVILINKLEKKNKIGLEGLGYHSK